MFDKFSTGNFYLREHPNREQGRNGEWEGLGNGEHTKNNKIQFPPLTRTRLGGQGGQGDKGEKQYKVCIFSKKNSPLKDHCPYKIFLVHFPS
ncbi:hypothetical protein, partial [Anabaena sp. CS-542/02]|uniref:hypothetical protein n=1 Tax=Anabaena sp. CS-542/02 TaxID=3021719 RepID=UPI00232B8E3A